MKAINVLIIDDEKICVEEVQNEINWKTLGIDSSCVFGANSVRQARNFLKNHPIHIVICDIEMPNENGLAFIEWITEWVRFSGEPVECIMLTCHPEYQYIRRALQLGCLDYVLKPMEPEELEAVLKRAVERIETGRQNARMKSKITSEDSYEDIVYEKILPYIDENLAKQLSVKDIADYVSLNPQYMMRLFKKKTGKGVWAYVTDCRMKLAKDLLLKTDWPIEAITEKCGYISSAHFASLFKRLEDVTPGQYRKNFR